MHDSICTRYSYFNLYAQTVRPYLCDPDLIKYGKFVSFFFVEKIVYQY